MEAAFHGAADVTSLQDQGRDADTGCGLEAVVDTWARVIHEVPVAGTRFVADVVTDLVEGKLVVELLISKQLTGIA
ncbi:hypothetical protein EYC80_001153 [Monilinia laxa]|uniref:Uncharacterized protein n=1 Tax=Monilinia laxa TaxID=61186 RepID=A0A5N6K985_MONLA|nr:hypothetical protein EYC80_001153 [Monilinia laxa]